LLTETTMSNQESLATPGRQPRRENKLPAAASCGRACLLALVGLLVVAAPASFVVLSRSPLPEEALVVALTGWADGVQQPTGESRAR
jgi:hypothetical protein